MVEARLLDRGLGTPRRHHHRDRRDRNGPEPSHDSPGLLALSSCAIMAGLQRSRRESAKV